jgi:linoleoyl-CoA desaturase
VALLGFAAAIDELGREARADAEAGARDVRLLQLLLLISLLGELGGRILLHVSAGPLGWSLGVVALTLHLALEAQINHSIMHGAYVRLPGGNGFSPRTYETLALPLQSRTWRDAHRIHHRVPSLLGLDPDTVHPLFRVHGDTPWRPWHRFNTFLGGLFVFETWALDYDRFLKATGHRPLDDRGELKKLLRFFAYQYLLFAALAGPLWWRVLAGTLFAVVIRNYVFVLLQTGSSVGASVSTRLARLPGVEGLDADAEAAFQVETSKDYPFPALATFLCGGLDRHIEHHLFPHLPPTRLRALSPRIRALCEQHGVHYEEHRSAWASLVDSFGYLAHLSRPPP